MSDFQETGLYELVALEPWRAGLGEPLGPLDPAWKPGPKELCDGQIDWEGTTKWWGCTKCGHIGCATTTHHIPVANPHAYHTRALGDFIKQRLANGVDIATARAQAVFIAAVALQYAATIPPDRLGNYIERHLVIR